jgi:hypothetical protein
MLQIYVHNVLAVFRHMFHLDGAITIQEYFNNRSDGCCRGDETLGRGKGARPRQSTAKNGGATGMVPWRGEERGVAGEGVQRT